MPNKSFTKYFSFVFIAAATATLSIVRLVNSRFFIAPICTDEVIEALISSSVDRCFNVYWTIPLLSTLSKCRIHLKTLPTFTGWCPRTLINGFSCILL